MARIFVFPTDERDGVCQAGIIKSVLLDEDIPKGESWIEVTGSDDELEITSFPEKFCIEDGKVSRKKEIVIRVKKRIFEPDGQDSAEIDFDFPEGVDEVDIEVQGTVLGKFKERIKKGQPLQITSNIMDIIRVKVQDPRLYADDRMSYVMAKRKGRRGLLEVETTPGEPGGGRP